MKYFLNNKLVRTSYNNYEFAITFNGRLIACCGDYAKAQKRYSSDYNYYTKYYGFSTEEVAKYLKIEKLVKGE